MILSSLKAKRGSVVLTFDDANSMEVHILKVRELNIRAPQNVPPSIDSSLDVPPSGKSDLTKASNNFSDRETQYLMYLFITIVSIGVHLPSTGPSNHNVYHSTEVTLKKFKQKPNK
jgi:hypothetical protein